MIVIGIILLSRASFTADLSAFLPNNPTQEQQLLVEQLRDGMVSRLILVGIEGDDSQTNAALSKMLAKNLRGNDAFVSINNGEPISQEKDRAYLFGNRYLLSSAVTPERFTAEGLHAALNDTLDLLASPAGLLVKDVLTQDPTGEMANLLSQLNGGRQPRKINGAWAAKDGKRALLLAQTKVLGSDTDGQERAINDIKKSFAAIKAEILKAHPQAADARLLMTGPGVFGVNARNTIKDEALHLSIISAVLIMALLLVVYRSGTAVVLGLMPVLSGVLAGTVAVSLGFGTVHGITMGFGTTLIGEAIDYSIYLFIQSGSARHSADWAKKSWPTIRLGVLTSIAGFGCLLFSGFPGLAQLGLYTIAGLTAAAFVTRFVLPSLLPVNFAVRDLTHIGLIAHRALQQLQHLRKGFFIIVMLSCAVLWINRDHLWQPELNALSPVSTDDQMLDAALRADIGAPDVRYLVVVKGKTGEDALQAVEKVTAQLDVLVDQGKLAAFETPSRYLPSLAMQRARIASLPSDNVLKQRLDQAVQGLPFTASVLTPFIASMNELAQTASQPSNLENRLLTRKDLAGTSMALATDSLLIERKDGASGLLPLTAAGSNGIDADMIHAALAKSGVQQAYFIDLKNESDKLYRGYMHEAILLALCGLAAMTILLGLSLRSFTGLIRVMVPLITAVLAVAAILALTDQRMTILHLIGLLLIVAVGSNYALFFAQSAMINAAGSKNDAKDVNTIKPTTLASLIFANITTVIGFGVLGFSTVPVLNAIGITVGIGVVLALLFSAMLSGNASEREKHEDRP
jgi:predicted exporter